LASPRVLIDSSIWVEFLRGRDLELVELVTGLVQARRAVLCGVVLSELLAGVKTRKDRDTLKQTLDALDYAEVSRATWFAAGEMAADLRRQGAPVPLTDLLVAALALENGCELLTRDSHFDRVPKLKRFRPPTGGPL
jgi:predicted nucleic acid-binding protein